MPELPDVIVYIDCLTKRVASRELQRIRLANPFVLRSVTPPLDAVEGRPIISLRRLGKRIVFVLTDELFIVLHLMIAGRLWWRPLGDPIPKKRGLAAFDFRTVHCCSRKPGRPNALRFTWCEAKPLSTSVDPPELFPTLGVETTDDSRIVGEIRTQPAFGLTR